MKFPSQVYEPQEDSDLLKIQVEKFAFGSVLDMGTGSGVQAVACAQKKEVTSVLALDIQKEVIGFCKKNRAHKKIAYAASDLFSSLKKKKQKKKFDTIIFNPPYLPQENKERDIALEGGKHGYEVVEKFLTDAKEFLHDEGIILLLFSSLTNKEKVDDLLEKNLLESEQLSKEHIFFEDLFVYKIVKSSILKSLSRSGFTDISYHSKGKRGYVFKAKKGKKIVAIKAKNPRSEAIGKISKEAQILKKVNKNGIGPKLFEVDEKNQWLSMEFLEGEEIEPFIKKSKKGDLLKAFRKIFGQLFILDSLGLEKEEMHHPPKHIIITKKGPILLDFERARYSLKPSNITQFCQYLSSTYLTPLLAEKNINIDKSVMIDLSREYRRSPSKKSLSKILAHLKG